MTTWRQSPLFDDDAGRIFLPATPPLQTVGELDSWLDQQPTDRLFGYIRHGAGELEALACLRAIIRREAKAMMT